MKLIRLTRILSLVAVISLVAAILPVTTVLAAELLYVYPDNGEIGTDIEVYGTGFIASYEYDLYFASERASLGEEIDEDVLNYEFLGTVTIDTDQTFTGAYFEVPSWLEDGDEDEKVMGGTYYIYVTLENYEVIVERAEFTVEAVASVTSISPSSGIVGTSVEIDGEGYDSSESLTVEYDGVSVSIAGGDTSTDSNGDFDNTKIFIPQSTAGTHTITVSGDDSDLADDITFTVTPDFTFSPASGAPGTAIIANGTGFGDEVTVTIFFDTSIVAQLSTDDDGSFTESFNAPVLSEGIYVIEALDANSNSDNEDFSIGAATLTLDRNEGNIGSTVTVTGSGFIASTEVTIIFEGTDVKTAKSDASGNLNTSFIVPALTVGDYGVSADDGTNTAGKRFNIATSTDISPVTSTSSPGNVGSAITISGMGFTPSSTVVVTYDGTQVTTAAVGTDGSFSALFNAPKSVSGAHTVVATQGANTQSFTFYMESTAPAIPPPLIPETGTKASAEAYFDWDDVTDPSGIIYSLQVSIDETFLAESLIRDITGITESEYTLTKEERLDSVSKEAPYYWRVKAMDNASNESDWSSASTFFIGFSFGIPQPVIYVIIGICSIVLAVFAFWMGRKTAYY
ncbi:IPT/TIG domain-containing protein [Chloroflexota bacterium]